MKYTSTHIANHLLLGPGRESRFGALTNMKLQKLIYYVKVWSIVDGQDVVSGSFAKWEHGPVEPSLYKALKINGRNPVSAVPGDTVTLDHRSALLADVVMYTYGRLSAYELSGLTHAEDPWMTTPKSEIITDDKIREFYSKHPFAVNFPLGDGPFYPLLTESAYAFTFDMSGETRSSTRSYPSFDAYRRVVDLVIESSLDLLRA